MEKAYALPESVRTAMLQYLAGQPWQDVNALIQALTKLAESSAEDAGKSVAALTAVKE